MIRISLSQAFTQWQELAADIPKDDIPMLSESWNNYTESLYKGGELCALQYHYCPAFDDAMPGEGLRFDPLADDREFILSAEGLRMRCMRVDSRPGGDSWEADASHWRVTLMRHRESICVFYSMGSAHTSEPDIRDVFYSLLIDSDSGGESFGDWCANYGYDTDSRKAEKTHRACKRIAAGLARLFSESELRDLRELFEDM